MLTIWILSIIATLYIADRKKLSVAGYFFVSLLTGPLAVLIVLLMPSREIQSNTGPYRVNSLEDAKEQLKDLRHSLGVQEERIKNLEIFIHTLSGVPADIPLERKIEPTVVTSVQESAGGGQEPPAPAKGSDVELDFGRNWLNKIGVVILALGVAFLISYSFQYFGPFLKIAFGYLVGGLLFFVGFKLETKEKFVNYGRVLLGGAWAIIYFTTYAMHHFDASRIIASQVADVSLLAVVVAGMITHVLKYKSEVMMSVVLFVAYLTSTIGPITSFTILSSLFLSVLVLFFVYKFQWIKTLTLGIVLTYGIHYIWVVPNLLSSVRGDLPPGIATANYHDFISFIFLTCYWAVFFAGVHIAKSIKDATLSRALAATNFGNIALYSVLSYPLVLKLFYGQRVTIVFIEGLIYLVSALVMKRWKQEKMYISDIVAGVFAITFSISLKFLPTSALLLWLIEVPFLLFIGTKWKERVFNYFSYALAVFIAFRLMFLGLSENMPDIHFLGVDWTWHGFMCFWAGISMAGCFYLTQRFKDGSAGGDIDFVFDQVFSFAACIYLSAWVGSWVHQPWITFSLSIEGLVFLALSLIMRLRRFRAYAYLSLGVGAIVFLCESISASLPVVKWIIVCCDVLTVFGFYYAMKFIKRGKLSELFFEHETEMAFTAGIILLVAAIHQYVSSQWMSLSLGLAGVLVIMTGFFDGNKTERMGGMALLALTLGRIVLVDLAGLEIIFKIITLIILGVLFLGVSYIYNRFSIKGK